MKIQIPAWKEYEKIEIPAWKEYEKKIEEIDKEPEEQARLSNMKKALNETMEIYSHALKGRVSN